MAEFVVCPACKGRGTVDNFGAFTSSDLDEWYGDSDERDEFVSDYRAGRIGRTTCGYCSGQRVVDAVDESGLSAERAWQEELDYRELCESEMRYMSDY